MPTTLPTYLPLIFYLFMYLPNIYLPIIYINRYEHLKIYVGRHVYLPTYLPTYLGTYWPTCEKNWSSNVVIHIDKKFHGSSRIHVKSIWYHVVIQCVGVVWRPKHWCGTKETKFQFPSPTYIMWNMYICIYTLYMYVNV